MHGALMRRVGRVVVGVSAVLALGAGCSSGDGDTAQCSGSGAGTGIEFKATFGLEDLNGPAKDSYSFDTLVLAGGKRSFPFTARNNASATSALPLKITAIRLLETDSAGKPVAEGAFRCEKADGTPCEGATFADVIPPGFAKACAADNATESISFTIVFDRDKSGGKTRRLRLQIDSTGDPAFLSAPREVKFEASPGQPRLSCSGAEVVDFGNVGAGKASKRTFKCLNTGSASVALDRVELFSATEAPLTIRFAGQTVTTTQSYEGTPAIEVPSGEAIEFEAELEALASADKETATLRIISNSAGNSELTIQLVANSTGPCLKLTPTLIEFGDVAMAVPKSVELQMVGCGSAAVEVVSITVSAQSGSDFVLDFATASFTDAKAPTKELPLTVQPNATEAVTVRFSPSVATAEPIVGQVLVETSDGIVRTVDLKGRGTEVACPVACIDPPAGSTTVVPQTKLTLTSACSSAATGHAVTQWEWTVTQPSGSKSSFTPNGKQPTVGFTPNVAGDYVFKLNIYDELGAKSCTPAALTYKVIPDNKIHVELTWTTAGDADPLDDKGSDLDLHIAHPMAVDVAGQKDLDGNGMPDPWYAQCYDSFWLNKSPSWGDKLDTDDDPSVDLDDDDGWGPENVSIKWPETDAKYWIGAYAWTDNGFGPSKPRVRIYLDQKLIFDKVGPDLTKGEMWCVARVKWDPSAPDQSANIEKCPGADEQGNLLTTNYPSANPAQTWTCL